MGFFKRIFQSILGSDKKDNFLKNENTELK